MSRTRSDSAHRKVLEAAMELVGEHGIEGTSMDAVAGRSGVSKATIYKHWKDKDTLLLEMMAELNGLQVRPTFDSGNVRADLVDVLAYRPPENTERRERIMPHLIAYSARNVEFGQMWRNMVMEPPRRELRRLLQAGVAKSELIATLDEDLSLALLLGPMMYWFIFLRRTTEPPRDLAASVVAAFWKAHGLNRDRRPGPALSKPKPKAAGLGKSSRAR
jgi:AcrR family transcriptional regulator